MTNPYESDDRVERLEHLSRERSTSFAQDDDLALAARNDSAAFDSLYVRHTTAVYRYLRTRTTNEDDAADLTALTFERAWVAIGGYRPGGSGVRAWLLRIARNAAIDHGRRRLAAPRPEHQQPRDDGLEARFVADEDAADLRRRVALLPADQRDAIVLRFATGLTAREIGTLLGKSEAASQKLVSRGLASLREAYDVRPTER